jgi:hypothetical protein
MTTRFLVLCTLDVTHVYYGGQCRDFTYVIPDDAARLLRRGRLLTRTLDGKLYVLFEADDNDAPLTPMPGAAMRIGLRLNNSFFSNFTALAFSPGSAVAVYRNGAGDTQLGAPTTAALAGSLLTAALSQSARPVSVTVSNAGGVGPPPIEVTAAADQESASFDLAGFAPGLYTVVETYPGNVQNTRAFYVDPELAREPLFGVVEIAIAAGFYAAPPAFSIAFDAREETLKYYVVGGNYTDAEFDQIGVAQLSANGPPEITFARKLPAAFAPSDLPPELVAPGGVKLALFESTAPVKRRAGGYARVQLSRQNDVIISNLPQVTPDRPNADLIVHLSKPKP